MANSDPIYVNGKKYATEPSLMERMKESFQTVDDKAKLEAIRKMRQQAAGSGITS